MVSLKGIRKYNPNAFIIFYEYSLLMNNIQYKLIDKLLLQYLLNNFFVSQISFSLDKFFFRFQLNHVIPSNYVFITGLARAGTTTLLNVLYNSDRFASLKYSNMPFLLMPNIWSKLHKTNASSFKERAHGDGIMVNNQSPEAFDEFFWKVFLKDSYIDEHYLNTHTVQNDTLSEYLFYSRLVCLSQYKSNYLAKNNNNILRLHSILQFDFRKTVFMLFRDPREHAMSLLKEHNLFSNYHKKDSFSIDYFNLLGHHEFGLNHKPFIFRDEERNELAVYVTMNPDYWLLIWRNYYRYALEHFKDEVEWLCFEDICHFPDKVTAHLNKLLSPITVPSIPERPKKSQYELSFQNQSLLDDCISIYEEMKTLVRYR